MDATSPADAARTQLERARAADHGRSARTVRGGHDALAATAAPPACSCQGGRA
jgi:hypothetical protein